MNKRISRGCALLLILAMLAPLSGCAVADELESLGIVAGAALDYDEQGNTMLTVEVINVSSHDSSSSATSSIFTSVGESLAIANEKLLTLVGRPLYWAHAALFLISRDVARNGIEELIQYIIRKDEIRISIPIYLADTPTAKEMFEAKQPAYTILSFGLRDTVNAAKEKSMCVDMPTFELYDELCSPSKSGVIPLIEMVQIGDETLLQPNGSAVFSDFKLAGELDDKQTNYYIMSQGQLDQGVLIDTDFSYEVQSSKTTVKVEESDGKIEFIYDIHLKLDLIHARRQASKEEQLQMIYDDMFKHFDDLTQTYFEEIDADFMGLANIYRVQKNKQYKLLEIPSKMVKDNAVVTIRPLIEILSYGKAEGEQK